MHMGANLEVASSKWPAAFCAFLAEASGAEAACVTRMLAIIKTNAFGIYSMAATDSTQAVSDPLHVAITDVGLSNMGLGLYLLVGRCNHECDPSAVWTFEDCAVDKTVSSATTPSALISHATSSGAGDLTRATSACMVLRALRPLRPGDPVTISYLLPRGRSQRGSRSYGSPIASTALARGARQRRQGGSLSAAALRAAPDACRFGGVGRASSERATHMRWIAAQPCWTNSRLQGHASIRRPPPS